MYDGDYLKPHIEHSKQDVIYQGLSLWNNLPLEITSCSSKKKFIRDFKKYLFMSYKYD